MGRLACSLDGRPVSPSDDLAVGALLPASAEQTVIAVNEKGTPIGAAWWHMHQPALLSDVSGAPLPELAMGVIESERGRGIGSTLIEELAARTALQFEALAANVHLLNPAVRLYIRTGFRVAGRVAGTTASLCDAACDMNNDRACVRFRRAPATPKHDSAAPGWRPIPPARGPASPRAAWPNAVEAIPDYRCLEAAKDAGIAGSRVLLDVVVEDVHQCGGGAAVQLDGDLIGVHPWQGIPRNALPLRRGTWLGDG